MNRAWRQSVAWGAALWLGATIALALAADRVLAPLDEVGGVAVVLVGTAATAALLVPLTRLFVRRSAVDASTAALVFGAGAGGTGLALDGLLLLVRGFDYPGVDATNAPTLVTALMCAYAAFVLVPPLAARGPSDSARFRPAKRKFPARK